MKAETRGFIGCLAGLIGVSLFVGGLFLIGMSTHGILFDRLNEAASLYGIFLMLGFLPASAGLLLCCQAWQCLKKTDED